MLLRKFGSAIMLLVLFTVLVMSCEPVMAQSRKTVDGVQKKADDLSLMIYQFSGTIKGTDTLTTIELPFTKTDTTYSIYAVFSSATDSCKYGVNLLAGVLGTYKAAESIFIDSAETVLHKRNTLKEVADKYKLQVYGRAGNGYTTSFTIYWVGRKR